MTFAESVIVVVNRTGLDAENIKRQIQFMDAPYVCSATPDRWLQQIGARRLEAVFVGPDLSDPEISAVVDEIGQHDPNVPIVVLSGVGRKC
jgi:hypothetical protein